MDERGAPAEVDAGAVADGDSEPDAAAADVAAALEAVLFIAEEPCEEVALASGLGLPVAQVRQALEELRAHYDAAHRGVELRRVGGGWRFYTRADQASAVERFVLSGQHARLTQAALETLAVIAYRQPVSRSRVSAVRGVNVDGVIRTLLARGLIEEAGTEPETGATLYRTTRYFLERLGINDLSELPPLADFLPEGTSIEELESSEDHPEP